MIAGCELSKAKPSAQWAIEADDTDSDYLCHTLFLKQVQRFFDNSTDKLRHPRSDAYSAQVLLNKQQIWCVGAYPDCYQLFCDRSIAYKRGVM